MRAQGPKGVGSCAELSLNALNVFDSVIRFHVLHKNRIWFDVQRLLKCISTILYWLNVTLYGHSLMKSSKNVKECIRISAQSDF